MSRARAYRLVRRGAKGLAPVIGAVAFAVAAGPTAAETLIGAIEAQIGPIAAVEQLSFPVPLELTSPDALDAQARLGFVNPDVLKHVPSEYGSPAAVVLRSSISFQVEEN